MKEELILDKAVKTLEQLNDLQVKLSRKEDGLAVLCKKFIKQQDVEISVVYQPSDGYCLLYSDIDISDNNIPVNSFLNYIKNNDCKKIDINDVWRCDR